MKFKIFNIVFVFFRNLDGKRIMNVVKHTPDKFEAKLLLQVIC
jgi:hypothetical protein